MIIEFYYHSLGRTKMTSHKARYYSSNWDKIFYTDVVEKDIYEVDDKTLSGWSGEVASWNAEETKRMDESLEILDIYMKKHREYIKRQRLKDLKLRVIYVRNTKIIQKHWKRFKNQTTP